MPPKRSTPSKPSPNSDPTTPNDPNKPSPDPSAAASRRSERKRKPREFADNTDASAAVAAVASPGKLLWTDDDIVALLKTAIEFRDRTGALPRKSNMDQFVENLKGLIDPQITKKQVGYKLKRMKGKYAHLNGSDLPVSPNVSDQERVVYDLWKAIWFSEKTEDGIRSEDEEAENDEKANGETANNKKANNEKENNEKADEEKVDEEKADEEKVDEENDEEKADEEKKEEEKGGGEFPFIRAAVAELSKGNGSSLLGAVMEEGIKSMDAEKGRVLEGKLRKQARADARMLVKRLKLMKEVAELFVPAQGNDA